MTIATARFQLICGAALAAIAMPAAATAQQRPFDVPAEAATRSIPEFARQAGIQIVAPGGKLRGLQTPPVKGNYDVRAALAMLLQGSGLRIVGDDGATIMLASAQQARLQPASLSGEASAARAPSAAAAPEHADRPITEPGDIVVTAQRYEQRLQDVPMSISAMSGDEIRARSAQVLGDLQYSVPGLSLFNYGVGASWTQLRGVSNLYGAATVGIYFDEVPITLSSAGLDSSFKLLDMERIEVLRGPQSTLYGEGSMGGTIRYIPAAPRLDRVSGAAHGEWSSTKDGKSNYELDGSINLPIVTDKIALRLVGGYEKNGGWIDSAVTGRKDINSVDITTFRGALRLKPTERFDIQLLAAYQKSNQANQNFGRDQKTAALFPTPISDRSLFAEAKFNYDLDFATLTGIGGYIDRTIKNTYDISSFYVPFLALFGIPNGYVTSIGLTGVNSFKIYSGELRLASHNDGPFSWAIGGTVRDLKNEGLNGSPTAPNTLPFDILTGTTVNENKSYAGYGELGYAFTPKLKATVGLRYYHEQKSQNVRTTSFGATTLDVGKANFHSLNPRFNLSYDFSRDAMIYASVAKGFRSGGFNNTSAGAGIIPIQPTYQPDTVWTYEAGGKLGLAQNKLLLDLSVYRTLWSQVQSYAFAPGSALTIFTNSGHVSGWGVDFSATARPMKALTLTGTLGWNNLAFDTTTVDKNKGDAVDGAVRLSYSAAIDYRPALTDHVNGIFRIDYQHAGKSSIVIRNFVPSVVVARPKRDLVNARIGAAFGPVELTVFANNLFNEVAPIIVGPFGVIAENVEARPRIIGVSASTKF